MVPSVITDSLPTLLAKEVGEVVAVVLLLSRGIQRSWISARDLPSGIAIAEICGRGACKLWISQHNYIIHHLNTEHLPVHTLHDPNIIAKLVMVPTPE